MGSACRKCKDQKAEQGCATQQQWEGGSQEASRQLPSHLQDIILKVFHQGVKNISLRGKEVNQCTDLHEIMILLQSAVGLD